jgi:23S rRNA pseudouridine1911/1915/1917 synthase
MPTPGAVSSMAERVLDVYEATGSSPVPPTMDLKIIYEDDNVLAVDKPAGIIVFPEGNIPADGQKTLIDYLIEKYPELKNTGLPIRFGIVHRLDKETSGIILVAKNNLTLKFLQDQLKESKVEKKYIALVVGKVKENKGKIETLIGRAPKDRRKQRVYLPEEPGSQNKRKAETLYKALERFSDYTLLEIEPKTGRKHQIRCHLAWFHHPIVGDKLYGFKNQPCPKELSRQFLHASYLKVDLPTKKKEFKSDLSEDLKKIIKKLKENDK